MGFWDFHQTEDGHWQWRYANDGRAVCLYGERFRSRNDCIADAMRHGYLSEPDIDGFIAPDRQNVPAESIRVPFLHRLLSR